MYLQDSENVLLYAAGDDSGGVSLWKVYPKSQGGIGPFSKKKKDNNQSSSKYNEKNEKSTYIQEESRLQCFLNINHLIRIVGSHSPRNTTSNNNEEAEVEKIVTLQFLPNKEFLLIGSNKRLILVVLGPAKFQGQLYGSGIYPNIWNQSVHGLMSHSKECSFFNWLSQSPLSSPCNKIRNKSEIDIDIDDDNSNSNSNSNDNNDNNDDKNINNNNINNNNNDNNNYNNKKNGLSFLSWVELDRVPSSCQGIFSMSVSVCAPTDLGSSTESALNSLNSTDSGFGLNDYNNDSSNNNNNSNNNNSNENNNDNDNSNDNNVKITSNTEMIKEEVRKIILWKVVVENEQITDKKMSKYVNNDRVSHSDKLENKSPTSSSSSSSISSRFFGNDENSNSIFSLPNISIPTFLNSKNNSTVAQSKQNNFKENNMIPPSIQTIPPVLTQKNNDNIRILNLNLRQEKEEKKMKGNAAVRSPGIRVLDPEDISDCRVYRFEWTDGMFDIAFQGLKNVPRQATEDYLTKFF